ncbi:MAG: LysR family transcriptional regulator [Bradymonadia bacterium]
MSDVHLTDLDLNLLVVLEILLQERNVTRTAHRLGRTQSAVSHALNRLRRQLDDPLLMRVKGEMCPSPWAESISPDLERLLSALRRMLSERNPDGASRTFTVACTGLLSCFFSPLTSALSTRLPNAHLEWVIPKPSIIPDLTGGDVDVLLSVSPLAEQGTLKETRLPSLDWSVLLRKDHPALSAWEASDFFEWPHVKVLPFSQQAAHLERIKASKRQKIIFGGSLPGFTEAAMMVSQTDMLCLVPHKWIEPMMDSFGLATAPPPLKLPELPLYMYWNAALDRTEVGSIFREMTYTVLTEHLSPEPLTLPA